MPETLEALRSGALAGSRELNLSSSALAEFPPEIFGLADTLEVLDLSNNELTNLPDDIRRLRKLRVLFCSNNRFTRLPPGLGDCPALAQLGFRRAGLLEIPAESLPPQLRWLTVTDNHLQTLPDSLGARPKLQKLMLAGNRLQRLPDSMSEASNLELIRLSANCFETLPPWLTDLPKLAWLAWAGNPMDRTLTAQSPECVDWNRLEIGRVLGEGASGRVYEGALRGGGPVAVKLFKGAMTSDGLPEREMATCLAAGEHPNLVGALGRVSAHPDGAEGLVMPLLPQSWRALAHPPSLQSCTRDVYDPDFSLNLDAALKIAHGVGAALRHLHERAVMHGDVYAHNVLWDGAEGHARLSDFGAASFLPKEGSAALQRIEVLSWGVLLGELLRCCAEASPAAHRIQQQCTALNPAERPTLPEALAQLAAEAFA